MPALSYDALEAGTGDQPDAGGSIVGKPRRRCWPVALAVTLVVPIAALQVRTAARAGAAPPPTITNYPAPYNISDACGITSGPDGALWFTNTRGNSIGRMDTSGNLVTYTDATVAAPCSITTGPDGALWFTNFGNQSYGSIGRITTDGTISNYTGEGIYGPTGITTGPDGALWFTNNRNDSIGRVTTDGAVTNFTSPTIGSPRAITSGPDGALWFTNSNSIGRITTSGVVTAYSKTGIQSPSGIASAGGALWFTNGIEQGSIGRISTTGTISLLSDPSIYGPVSITLGPDGALWFTNVTNSTIGRITTVGKITHFTTPFVSSPSGITSGPDGALWFTDSDTIWRISTAGVFTRYRAPGPQRPYGMTAGPDGAMWFTNIGNDSIGRIDASGSITTYTGNGVLAPLAITVGADGALWFTNSGNEALGQKDSIGRITTAGAITNFTDPGLADPSQITSGPDGALWFTNPGNNSIGRITTAGTVTYYTDATVSTPADITAGPDGALWFTNSANNSIGRITTAGAITNYTNADISTPLGITTGPDGALWFTNHGQNANWVGRLTTTGTFSRVNATTAQHIATGPDGALWLSDPDAGYVARLTTDGILSTYFDPTISQPWSITAGPDGGMWFANGGNNSIGRISIPPPPAAPDPPTDVTALATSQGAVVNWVASVGDNGSPITSYTVTASPGGATAVVNGALRTATVTGLDDATTYTFTVHATNALGNSAESEPSNPITYQQNAPGAPTYVSAMGGPGHAYLQWLPPDDGGSPITSYVITASPGGATMTVSGPASNAIFAGLDYTTTYTFTLHAVNAIGAGPESASSNAIIPNGPPAAPENVTATAGDGSAVVSWSAANDRGLPIQGYTIAVTPGEAEVSVPADQTSATVSGLTNGTAYFFEVWATNAAGAGLGSDFSNTVTPTAAPPSAPVVTVSFPSTESGYFRSTPATGAVYANDATTGGSAIVAIDCTGATVSGFAAVGTLASATLSVSGDGTHSVSCTATDGAANTGAAAGSANTATVRIDTQAPVGPVSGLSAAGATTLAAAIPVTWSATDNFSGVASYDVQSRTSPWSGSPGAWTNWKVETSARSATFTAKLGSTNCFRERATDNAGNISAWSAPQCKAMPLRSDQLLHSAGWTKRVSSAYYAGFAYSSAIHGAKMTRTGIVARRLAVVLTECAICGTVQIRWNGVVIANVNTHRSATARKQVVQIANWEGPHAGTVTLTVTSPTGKAVVVEGLSIYNA